jgi:hypothetical protein
VVFHPLLVVLTCAVAEDCLEELQPPDPPSPVELCLKQVLATAERPCTEANVIALQEHLQTLCKAIEQTKSELPLQLFALLDDPLRRTALVALCQAIIVSTINTLARERAERRIITPGDRRRS